MRMLVRAAGFDTCTRSLERWRTPRTLPACARSRQRLGIPPRLHKLPLRLPSATLAELILLLFGLKEAPTSPLATHPAQRGRLTTYATGLSLVRVLALCTILAAVPCAAEPTPAWPKAQQPLAAAISNIALGAQIGLDTAHSFKAEDRKHAFCEQGLGAGLEIGLHSALVALFPRERPDGSDMRSFPSGHAGLAGASGGYNYSVSVSLTALVGFGRVGANVHHPSDVIFGALLGTGSRLLAARVCR